jgi:hypothetical protein
MERKLLTAFFFYKLRAKTNILLILRFVFFIGTAISFAIMPFYFDCWKFILNVLFLPIRLNFWPTVSAHWPQIGSLILLEGLKKLSEAQRDALAPKPLAYNTRDLVAKIGTTFNKVSRISPVVNTNFPDAPSVFDVGCPIVTFGGR